MNDKFITKSIEQRKERVLLVDWSNLAMRVLFSLPYDPTDEQFSAWRCRMLKSVYLLMSKHDSDRIIFCLEGRKNWRKEYYPEYKANRVVARNASRIDFDKFFQAQDEFVDSITKFLCNCQFLRVEHAEADDLIAVITMAHPDWLITNISTDRDFYQLYKYSNYKQYDAIKDSYVEVLNPENYLLEKVVIGDSSDNIPKLKNKVGPKTAAKIINSDEGLDEWLKLENLEKEFQRNLTLISFDFIPEHIQTAIKHALDDWTGEKFVARNMMKFLSENHCLSLFENMNCMVEVFSRYDKSVEELNGQG